jgi:septum formation protein
MILASGSPRRKSIMLTTGYKFSIVVPNIAEDYPPDMAVADIPVYLAEKKAQYVQNGHPEEIIVAADTIVVLNNKIIGKPSGYKEALEMLQRLSGHMHTVITGVCVLNGFKRHTFSDTSKVYFQKLSKEEIEYYVKTHKPYDKAGSYGVQDWIGMVAIRKIEGSFYNVMGLPIHKLYQVLKKMGTNSHSQR